MKKINKDNFEFLKNSKVLVTGAGGFIGSHLIEALYKINCREIKALVHYNSGNNWGNIEYLPNHIKTDLTIMLGDLRDMLCVKKAAKGMNVIFHLGAIISIPYSYLAPQSLLETNASGTLNILQASLEEGVDKIIHTSTSEVYGSALYVPIDENHPLQAQSPYSASKIAADKIAESYYRSFDLPVAVIRPFNTYGPRQSARAIIPTILSQLLQKDNKKIKLGSLKPVRDLNYVEDIVKGFLLMAENERSIGKVINIGSGDGTSIKNLVIKIIDLFNSDVEIEVEKVRFRPEKSEVDKLICNNKKAKEILNWNPSVDLEEGLIRTKEYIENNIEKYKSKIYNI
ncbi:GDP-mannose 4,6-dehydratase [Thermodesulfobacteriota bacterium]